MIENYNYLTGGKINFQWLIFLLSHFSVVVVVMNKSTLLLVVAHSQSESKRKKAFIRLAVSLFFFPSSLKSSFYYERDKHSTSGSFDFPNILGCAHLQLHFDPLNLKRVRCLITVPLQ